MFDISLRTRHITLAAVICLDINTQIYVENHLNQGAMWN